MPKQLSLNLSTLESADSHSIDNFVLLEENSAAFNFLEKFFTQKNFSQSQFPSLILKGAQACGKTHLLNIFAKKFGAEFLEIEKINPKNLSKIFVIDHFYILENIDQIKNDELLFHLLNSAFASGSFLILSSRNNPKFTLKDLNSRVKNIVTLQIKDPSISAIEILLINSFARRQIKVSTKVINFISTNISRNYSTISDIVIRVEDYCRENAKSLTLREAEELTKQ